jgi:hypothetical protein
MGKCFFEPTGAVARPTCIESGQTGEKGMTPFIKFAVAVVLTLALASPLLAG